MKQRILILISILMIIGIQLSAQDTHTIDFEPEGVGADWNWVMAENSDNPPLEFVGNPVSGGINTSGNVAKFIARAEGNPWALCHTSDDGEYTFDADNSIIKIMVYKPVISNIGFKVEGFSGAHEIQIPNTLVNEWEEITFDFSAMIGNTYGTMVIIPDFAAREQENIIYFDNIQIPDGSITPPPPEPEVAAPAPAHEEENVLSIYSDAYTNLAGTDFNPAWGQSTTVTVDYPVAGNNTLKYENLNYQGTQFLNQDVTGYDFLHVDFWTPNASNLSFFLISPGAEINYDFTIEQETWVSVDIPLSHYDPPVNLADVFQFKVTGNGTVWFDNWYFWDNPNEVGTDASLSDLQVDGVTVAGFTSGTLNYDLVLPEGTTIVPDVTAATTDPNATYVVNNAAELPGTSTVLVTAEDGVTTQTYSVNFTVDAPEPEPVVAAPTPAEPEEDVISLFSNVYNDVTVDTWSTDWDVAEVEDMQIAGDDVKKYTSITFAGIEFTSQTIDASAMTNFRFDLWTPGPTAAPAVIKIKLVDFGADGAWSGGDDVEHELIFDENSTPALISESWISFDIPLSDFAGLTTTGHLAQLIISSDPNIIYLDNVYFYNGYEEPAVPEVAAPVPTAEAENVIAIFSDSYPNLDGTDFNPFWGQSTVVTTEEIEGNSMLKYDIFNYQGTQLAEAQDLSLMEYLHIDMWTSDATVVLMSPISVSTGEFLFSLSPIESETWNSYDIPLSSFEGLSMSDIHQLKFDGQAGVNPSTIYLDNIYFWKEPTPQGEDATLSDLQVDGTSIEGFAANILNYDVMLAEGTTTVPTVEATTTDPNASYIVNNALAIPGTTEVVVTAENGSTMLTYNVNFLLPDPMPETAAPDPSSEEVDVVSIFSDSYTDIEGTNFNPSWGQSTVVTTEEIDGNFMLKYDNFNYQGTEFAAAQDLSLMEYVHIDMWTNDATVVLFSPISSSTGEFLYSLSPLETGTWNSYDIPVTAFEGVSMTDIFQLKFDGQQGETPSLIYLDNIYFWKEPAAQGEDATLSDLQVDGISVEGFASNILSYDVMLEEGTTTVPTVDATTTDPGASYVVNDAAELPGTTQVVVTAEDGVTTLTYSVNFLLPDPEPEVAAPAPTINEAHVISLFSNAYTDVTVDTWSADWDQADLEEIQIAGDDVKKYSNITYAGIEFTSQTIDATGMTNFSLDLWTPGPTSAPAMIKIKLVDFGADGLWGGGDDVEHELTFDETTGLVSEEWISFDISLDDFTGLVTREHLAQLIISSDPNTIYVDNIYFYDGLSDTGETPEIPENHKLGNNYPNPFNPVTNISYSLAEQGYVTLAVYDVKGRLVDTLVKENCTAGTYQHTWNAEGAASGIYFYRLQVNGQNVSTKRMILLK